MWPNLISRVQLQIATKAKQAIAKRYGTSYTVGNIAQTICKFAYFAVKFQWVDDK